MIPFSSRHGGNLAYEARRLGCRIDQVLDASSSLVPFPPSRSLRRCLIAEIRGHGLRNYPDRHHKDLREAIGIWHGIDPAMVLPGNGASELFTWAARDASLEGISGLPSPGFSDYVRALCCWSAPYVHQTLPLSWSLVAPETFPLSPKTDVLWLTNPHNPTGQLWSRESIIPLLDNYKLIICDEAFLPLVPYGEQQSVVSLVSHFPNLIVIRSLTKLFAIAGLRLGYAISTPDRLMRWREWRDPWPVNGLALAAGTMLLEDHLALERWLAKIQSWVANEGSWFYRNLLKLPRISVHPSSANFFLVKGNSSLVSFREQLAQRRILVRDCSSFPELGGSWLRIALQDRAGNRRILRAMNKLINQL